jgi:hypothetical protein
MRSGGRGAVRSMSWRASVRILRWCTELSMDLQTMLIDYIRVDASG